MKYFGITKQEIHFRAMVGPTYRWLNSYSWKWSSVFQAREDSQVALVSLLEDSQVALVSLLEDSQVVS